jgi:hypothetical protein
MTREPNQRSAANRSIEGESERREGRNQPSKQAPIWIYDRFRKRSEMKAHQLIHRLAILTLFVVAIMSIVGSMDQSPGAPMEMRLAPLFGLALWGFLLWKIWKRPRQWGLGVGIFLFLMIVTQSYFWWRGVNNPETEALGGSRSMANFILLFELPIFAAGVFCILLRFYGANEQPNNGAKGD